MEYFDLDGARMAYDLAGAGDTPLVLLHGFACNRTFLAPQMEHFAAGRLVLSVDFLGHGDSDKPRRAYRIPGFVAEVARLLEHLELTGVVVVGHSMGGSVALELAVGWPERVRAAAALDSTLISSVERKTKGLPSLLRSLEEPDYAQAVDRYFGGMFLPGDGEELKRRVQGIMSSAPRHVLIELTKALIAWDGPPALARLKRPLLYLGASRPLTSQADMLAASPWVQYAQAAGTGHFLTLVTPAQVNAVIERWLAVLPFAEAES
ncbi:MAG: alpha/beta hydrolase [Proteobacteria bacterium]|nr:alpha/beta hydrolase [Pseudomonadota bacterium]MBU2517096.1 alpha/beta hydrolase [Pseudomonadota bacterium]